MRARCPPDIVIDHFEFYNTETSTYEERLPSDNLEANTRVYYVLASLKDMTKTEVLCIEGRAFDISEGLHIGQCILKIEEKANRSEGE